MKSELSMPISENQIAQNESVAWARHAAATIA
jgi:hypothetical protein